MANLSQRYRSRRKYQERKEEGVCVICLGKRDNETLRCNKCREHHKRYQKKKTREKKWKHANSP